MSEAPQQLYQCIRDIKKDDIHYYERVSETINAPLDLGESKKGEDYFTATWFFHDNLEEFRAAIAIADAISGNKDAKTTVMPVVGEDWELKTVNSFKPIVLGRFFINRYGEAPTREHLIPIRIPAGMAFGTGEHPSTAECLNLLEKHILDAKRTVTNGLDMGCGSGILSIAAAKTIGIPFTAVDIDPDSITVCKENLEENGVAEYIKCEVADGFNGGLAEENAPYDLVFANMTANPVTRLAPDFSAHMKKGGLIFISGYLDFQKDQVHNAYIQNGFKQIDEWQASDKEDVWVVGAYEKI